MENRNEGLEKIMGKKEGNTRNNNEERMIIFFLENNPISTNTRFRHKDIHKFTR